eukprot:2544793-Rhodomonas_salina.1
MGFIFPGSPAQIAVGFAVSFLFLMVRGLACYKSKCNAHMSRPTIRSTLSVKGRDLEMTLRPRTAVPESARTCW